MTIPRRLFTVVWMQLLTLLAEPSYAINPPSLERQPIRPTPGTKSEISGETAWRQLLPLGERDHFSMIAPPPLHDYLSGQMAASQTGSAAVNPKLEGVTIRLPGFIVPLTFTASGSVGEFLLVPYAGACIHVPPPPPNQTVFIKLDKAMQLTALYEAYWVSGTLHAFTRGSRFGEAAYSIDASKVEPYEN